MRKWTHRAIVILSGWGFFVLLWGLVLTEGCRLDENFAKMAIENRGYTNPVITNKDWLLVPLKGCRKLDIVKFRATAVDPEGNQVELEVCTEDQYQGAQVKEIRVLPGPAPPPDRNDRLIAPWLQSIRGIYFEFKEEGKERGLVKKRVD